MGKNISTTNRLACFQADLVNIAYNINPVNYEDYVTRRWLLKVSYASLSTLEKRVMDMVRILYTNPSKCFNRKNGKNYIYNEALEMLDKKMEDLGVMYQRQYDLLKGVMNSDKKKFDKLKRDDISDKDIIEILVSKTIGMIFE